MANCKARSACRSCARRRACDRRRHRLVRGSFCGPVACGRGNRRCAIADAAHDSVHRADSAFHYVVRHRRRREGRGDPRGHHLPDVSQHLCGRARCRSETARSGERVRPVEPAIALRIILPTALPSILVGVRYSSAVALLALVVAEQINAQNGIGYILVNANQNQRADIIIAGILVYAALGIVTDLIMRALEHLAFLGGRALNSPDIRIRQVRARRTRNRARTRRREPRVRRPRGAEGCIAQRQDAASSCRCSAHRARARRRSCAFLQDSIRPTAAACVSRARARSCSRSRVSCRRSACGRTS